MKKRGFSLIELLVVMAIVGVLAAIAAPVYRNYRLRGIISQGLVFADTARKTVEQSYSRTGSFPTSDMDFLTVPIGGVRYLHWPIARQNIELWYSDPDIVAGSGGTNEVILTLTPSVSTAGVITWTCASSSLNTRRIKCMYLPASCQNANCVP